ncbi:GFA family protein [Sulfuriferula sp. AH1]|uniref:GFA family protein n=1 Tax=Sulfuriferula sp. AH1 TaxID=1985873 RepID=UPI000B3B8E82|nr:GFA family protein [Sulfuriferula sp. AH1]
MKGSCLCGAIEYEVDRLDMHISHCHCRTCRKAHAAAFASTAGVMRERFRWVKGQEKLAAFESSPGKFRHFCSVCGTHLVAERSAQPHVIVRVATLDEDPGVKPVVHIWCAHDVPWLQDDKAIPYHQEWQPDR